MADKETYERDLLHRFLDRLEERVSRARRASHESSSWSEAQTKQDAFFERAWEFASELKRQLPMTMLTFEEREHALARLHAILAHLPRHKRAQSAVR